MCNNTKQNTINEITDYRSSVTNPSVGQVRPCVWQRDNYQEGVRGSDHRLENTVFINISFNTSLFTHTIYYFTLAVISTLHTKMQCRPWASMDVNKTPFTIHIVGPFIMHDIRNSIYDESNKLYRVLVIRFTQIIYGYVLILGL